MTGTTVFGFFLTTIGLIFLILIFIVFRLRLVYLLFYDSSFSFHANNAESSALCTIVVMFASNVDTLHVENMSDNRFRVYIEKSERCNTSSSNPSLYSYFI